jgi:Na+-transporting NADH:ubiquinone oxidoreductase subunit NqrB
MTPAKPNQLQDSVWNIFTGDPRYYQIAALSSLLVYGVGWLSFDIGWPQILVSLGVALLAQYACTELWGLPKFDPRSPLISGLSLCLLLRSNSLLLVFIAAVVTIASKFIFKRAQKHIFNPTNIGIVAMMLLTHEVWVSPAQWGSKAHFAFFIACAGGIVIYRAARSDVTYAFLLAYAGILFGRAYWLGDPWAIPIKQLQSGALLLFAFYMISDPKTTPDSRAGRILFAILVAAGAAYVQFSLYRTNGLLWSLAICSLLTPLIDRLLPGTIYQWNNPKPSAQPKGESHEADTFVPRPLARLVG